MLGSFRVSQLLGGLMAIAALAIFAVLRARLKKAAAEGSAPVLWRDTEECRLQLEGKWDYKANAPKEEPKADSDGEEVSEEAEQTVDDGEQ